MQLANRSTGSVPLIASTIPPGGVIGLSGANLLSVIRVKHPTGTLTVPTLAGGGSYVSIESMSEYATSDPNEDSSPPIIVYASPEGGLIVLSDSPLKDVPGTIAHPLPPDVTSPETTGSFPTMNPGYAETSDQVPIPDDRHVELESSLDSDHTTISVAIPVDPKTVSLAMSLPSTGTGGIGPLPSVERVTLEDPKGNPIDEVGTFWGPQATEPVRDLTLSLDNAPAGGNLLVEISVPTAGNSASGSVSTNWQVPFLMDIVRQELGSSSSAAAGLAIAGPIPGLVQSGIGVLSTETTSGQGEDSGPTLASTVGSLVAVVPETIVTQGEATPSESELAGSVVDETAGFNLRVGSGPLASRSASPLGPALAIVLDDPAPAVDRHERALSQAIEGDGSDDSTDRPASRPELTRYEGAGTTSGEGLTSTSTSDGTRVASAGLGAFRLKVTDLGGKSDRADMESLMATLPGSLGQEPSSIVATRNYDEDEISALQVTPGDPSRADRMVLDYVTVTCGLALGLSLTAGPLFPDVLALISSRARRRGAVPSSPIDGRVDSAQGRAGGIGNWLKGALSSRLRRESRTSACP